MIATRDQCEVARHLREEAAERRRWVMEQWLSPDDEVTSRDGEEGWGVSLYSSSRESAKRPRNWRSLPGARWHCRRDGAAAGSRGGRWYQATAEAGVSWMAGGKRTPARSTVKHTSQRRLAKATRAWLCGFFSARLRS